MRIRTVLLVAATAVSLTACDSAMEQLTEEVAERAAEQSGAGDTEIDIDEEGGLSVETDEGSLNIDASGDGELPEGFPEGIPLPDDYTVTSSTSFSDADGEAFQVTMTAPGLDVTAFIEEDAAPGLESSGYEVTGQTTTTNNDVTFSTVTAEDGSSSVNIAAQEQTDGDPVVTVQVFPAG